MDTSSIRWEVFTRVEREHLKNAMHKGDYKIFTNLMEEMNPSKEAELQKLVDLFAAKSDDYESPVRKEIEKDFLNKNPQDLTPKEEAKFQKKLDEEKAMMAKKSQKKDSAKDKLAAEVAKSLEEKEAKEAAEGEAVEKEAAEGDVVKQEAVEKGSGKKASSKK